MDEGTEPEPGPDGPTGAGESGSGEDREAVPDDPDFDDVMDELESLEESVDSDDERRQVRQTMRVVRRAGRRRPIGRVRDSFDTRDLGEALVGSFVFGMPMIVEGGTYEIGAYISTAPSLIVATAGFGFLLVLGILWAAEFEKVESDFVFGVVPVRLIGIVGVAVSTATLLMTMWGTVDWSDPVVAASQTLVTAVVMSVGASLGDVLPES